ncbi:GNAT family N-acetyltransferase [Streptomyces sp. NPDC051098]|uniref:GNAT family N-acetyltransferase n=1 Tax=Streptomyces sp. NPDC051098 TaxID=3155411 RepID=UPI003434345B
MLNGGTEAPRILVRPRTDTDIPSTSTALVAVHASDGYPVEGVEHPEHWLTPEGLIQSWVAELAGKIVGHVCITRARDEAAVDLYLEQSEKRRDEVAVMARLFVIPEARRNSTGERLVREAATYAQKHGLALVGDVMAKDASAIRLYERLGCQIIGTTRHSYGEGQETSALCFVAPTD